MLKNDPRRVSDRMKMAIRHSTVADGTRGAFFVLCRGLKRHGCDHPAADAAVEGRGPSSYPRSSDN